MAAVALAIGVVSGSAYAFFTGAGSGVAGGAVDSPAVAVTVVAATGAPSTQLVPGASADLVLQLDNPNSFPVTIIAVSQSGAVIPLGGTGPGTACTTLNNGVSVATQSGLAIAVASGAGIVVHVPNAASMTTASASGCQGATFHIPLSVSVRQ